MIYVLAKVLVLNDYFCYNEIVLNNRILAPHTPTTGGLLTAAVDFGTASALLSALFIVFCLCYRKYSNFFLKPNENMQMTSKNYSKLLAALTILMIFLITPSTFTPYCFGLFPAVHAAPALLLVSLFTFVLDTRSEAPLGAAPIPERPPTVNTSITVAHKLKSFLNNGMSTCNNIGAVFIISIAPHASTPASSGPSNSSVVIGFVAVMAVAFGGGALMEYTKYWWSMYRPTVIPQTPPVVRPEAPANIVDAVTAGMQRNAYWRGTDTNVSVSIRHQRMLLDEQVKQHTDLAQKAANLEASQDVVTQHTDTMSNHLLAAKAKNSYLKAAGVDPGPFETLVNDVDLLLTKNTKLRDDVIAVKDAAYNYKHPIHCANETSGAYTETEYHELARGCTEQGREFIHKYGAKTGEFRIEQRTVGDVWRPAPIQLYNTQTRKWEIKQQVRAVRGSLGDDYDFVTAFVEQDSFASLRYGVLFLVALSALCVYSIIFAGGFGNLKYTFIGSFRSAAYKSKSFLNNSRSTCYVGTVFIITAAPNTDTTSNSSIMIGFAAVVAAVVGVGILIKHTKYG